MLCNERDLYLVVLKKMLISCFKMALVSGMRWVEKLVISFQESVISIVIFSFNKSYKHSAQKISTLYLILYSIKQNPLNHSIFIPFLPILRLTFAHPTPLRRANSNRSRSKTEKEGKRAERPCFACGFLANFGFRFLSSSPVFHPRLLSRTRPLCAQLRLSINLALLQVWVFLQKRLF